MNGADVAVGVVIGLVVGLVLAFLDRAHRVAPELEELQEATEELVDAAQDAVEYLHAMGPKSSALVEKTLATALARASELGIRPAAIVEAGTAKTPADHPTPERDPLDGWRL